MSRKNTISPKGEWEKVRRALLDLGGRSSLEVETPRGVLVVKVRSLYDSRKYLIHRKGKSGEGVSANSASRAVEYIEHFVDTGSLLKRAANPSKDDLHLGESIWKLQSGEWVLSTHDKALNKSVNALKAPAGIFGKDEAGVVDWELRQSRYVKEAAEWSKHYQQAYRKWAKQAWEWEREFGEEDPNYQKAASKAFWQWLAWELVARRHQGSTPGWGKSDAWVTPPAASRKSNPSKPSTAALRKMVKLPVPRTLKGLRADPRIQEIWQENDGFNPKGLSYWASLTPGLTWDGVYNLHESTVRELADALSRVTIDRQRV